MGAEAEAKNEAIGAANSLDVMMAGIGIMVVKIARRTYNNEAHALQKNPDQSHHPPLR